MQLIMSALKKTKLNRHIYLKTKEKVCFKTSYKQTFSIVPG